MRGTRFTAITGVNTLFNALLNYRRFLRLDFSSLRLAVAGGMVCKSGRRAGKQATGKPLDRDIRTDRDLARLPHSTIEGFTGAIGLPLPSTERDPRRRGFPPPLGEAVELCVKDARRSWPATGL